MGPFLAHFRFVQVLGLKLMDFGPILEVCISTIYHNLLTFCFLYSQCIPMRKTCMLAFVFHVHHILVYTIAFPMYIFIFHCILVLFLYVLNPFLAFGEDWLDREGTWSRENTSKRVCIHSSPVVHAKERKKIKS